MITENITQLFINLLNEQPEKKGRINVADMIERLNTEEVQEAMKKIVEESKPKKVKILKEKKIKDENAPKRPKSAYMFFCDKKRPEMKENNPDMKMSEISKLLGASWKEISPERKEKYNKKAEKDKERYAVEIKEYVRPSDEELLAQKGKKQKKEDGFPKGAKTAFMYFCEEMKAGVREENPDFKTPDVLKELARMWKEDYGESEKRETFVAQAKKDKERFGKEKEEWEKKNGKREGKSKSRSSSDE